MTLLKISLLTSTLLLSSFARAKTEQNAQKASPQRDARSLDPSLDEDNEKRSYDELWDDDEDDYDTVIRPSDELWDDDEDDDDNDDDKRSYHELWDDDDDIDNADAAADDHYSQQQQQQYHNYYHYHEDGDLFETLKSYKEAMEMAREFGEEMYQRPAIACKVDSECFEIDGWTHTGGVNDRLLCCPEMDGQGMIVTALEKGITCGCRKAPPPAVRCKVDSGCTELGWDTFGEYNGHIVCCPDVLGQTFMIDKNGICGCLRGPKFVITLADDLNNGTVS